MCFDALTVIGVVTIIETVATAVALLITTWYQAKRIPPTRSTDVGKALTKRVGVSPE